MTLSLNKQGLRSQPIAQLTGHITQNSKRERRYHNGPGKPRTIQPASEVNRACKQRANLIEQTNQQDGSANHSQQVEVSRALQLSMQQRMNSALRPTAGAVEPRKQVKWTPWEGVKGRVEAKVYYRQQHTQYQQSPQYIMTGHSCLLMAAQAHHSATKAQEHHDGINDTQRQTRKEADFGPFTRISRRSLCAGIVAAGIFRVYGRCVDDSHNAERQAAENSYQNLLDEPVFGWRATRHGVVGLLHCERRKG